MFRCLSATLLLILAVTAGADAGGPGKAAMGPATALLVIDIQSFYFEGGSLALSGRVVSIEAWIADQGAVR
jgi:hypothetical protein